MIRAIKCIVGVSTITDMKLKVCAIILQFVGKDLTLKFLASKPRG